ncbi:MAG: ABC transporter ATP-binding protein [Candidatus ainarchaeum sp.]|nr:ABC transporter ATP-binding protein [Candidatus ainarchaeum sp.]
MNKEMIRLENVSKIYNMGEIEVKALDEIDMIICQKDYVSIMGPSGSGKTTLLDVMSIMNSPSKGKIFIEGKETTKMSNAELSSFRGKKIGFIFQTFNLLPKLTAIENVIVPMWINNIDRKKRFERAKSVLESVGLGDKLYNKPNQLSGGQRQRVCIARALALNPNIIVADEPTGNLDSKSGKIVMDILSDLNKKEDKTIVLVTHDQSIGSKAKKQILLKDGKIVSGNNKVCQL